MVSFIWAVGFFMALILGALYKKYFHFVFTAPVMVAVLIVTIIVFVVLFLFFKNLRNAPLYREQPVLAYIISFLLCYAIVFIGLGSINRGLDFSIEKSYVCKVIKKQYRQQKISVESHYLTLTNELLSQEKVEISVSAQDFNKIQEGQNVGLHLRNGLFGWMWISRISY